MGNESLGAAELSLPMLAGGIVLALLGWILYWGGLTALGAVLGAGLGSGAGAVAAEIAGWTGTGATVATVCGGIGGAILGALALRVFHSLVFFLCGVALGSLAAQHGLTLAHQLEWTWADGSMAEILVRSAGALVGGVLLVFLSKFIIVIVTSTLGTLLIVGAWPTNLMLFASIPIWLFSILTQYSIARRLNLFERAKRPPKE